MTAVAATAAIIATLAVMAAVLLLRADRQNGAQS